MKLSIIIVSYNTKSLTIQTLESIEKELKRSKLLEEDVEVIVVDNNSTDDSADSIQQYSHTVSFPLILIKNTDNVGFAKANNIGIKRARGKYYLLLNSDTIVIDQALEKMVVFFDSHDTEAPSTHTTHSSISDNVGILSPRLLYPDKSPQPQGGNFPTLATLFFHMSLLDDVPIIGKYLPSTQHTGKRTPDKISHVSIIKKDWVAGTAMLIRKEVISDIGLLDEGIFMYGEDIEFCLRARNHAWDIVELQKAHLIHIQNASGSSQNAIRGELKGYLHIWAKHKPLWQFPLVKAILFMGVLIRIILFATIAPNKQKVTLYKKLLKEIHTW